MSNVSICFILPVYCFNKFSPFLSSCNGFNLVCTTAPVTGLMLAVAKQQFFYYVLPPYRQNLCCFLAGKAVRRSFVSAGFLRNSGLAM